MLKTVSKKSYIDNDSFYMNEIVKAKNGMLFKLHGDVHNCSNTWEIHVWSNALCQWNWVADMNSIPDVEYVRYSNCLVNCQANPQFKLNWTEMKHFVDMFVNAL